MMKKIVVWVIIIVIVVLVAVVLARNLIVKKAVEEGGDYALGVETKLGSADLDLIGSSLKLKNYQVGNPEGFKAGDFMDIRLGVLAVESGSIFSHEVVVDSLVLDGIDLNFEQIDTKGNYAAILDHIKKLDLGSSSESDQKFRIKQVSIRNISVAASLTLMGKEQYAKTFTVENISLQNIGGDNGATIGEITARVLKAVISKAATVGRSQLPGGFGQNLDQLKDKAVQEVESTVSDDLKKIGGSLLKGKK
jgi:hypothetical protein